MPPSFLWPKASAAVAFENHLAALEHCAFRYQHDRVAAGIAAAVFAQEFSQPFDVESVLGNHATVGGPGHGRQHGGETGVTTKDLEHHEAFVGSGRSPQPVGHLDGAGDAGAESDAVVGSRDVVVHGLRNCHDFHAFLVQAHAVAQGVIAADRDQVLDAEPLQVLQNFGRQIVLVGRSMRPAGASERWPCSPCWDWCGNCEGKCRRCVRRD